jgi:hypothetical protein
MIQLPNSTSILASGKAGTLAVTVLAADRETVLVPRSFGTLAEIGATAVYWGPPLAVDAAASGFLRYDTDGDASTVGVVVDLRPFAGAAAVGAVPAGAIATAVWAAAPAGTPLDAVAAAVRQEMDAGSTRLAYLDAAVSTRAAAATALSTAVWTDARAASLDAAVSGVSGGGVSAEHIATAVWAVMPAGTPVADIATAVWAAAPAGIPLADLAAAVRDVDLASPAPGSLGAAVADVRADLGAVKLKTDNLPARPAAVGSDMGTVTAVTGSVGSVTAPVTAGTVTDKAGYSLGAAGLDAISLSLTASPKLSSS